MSQGEARALLAEIVRPINEAAGARAVDVYHTLKSFIKGVYLPVYTGRWKHSTASTETDRIRQQILPALGDCSIRELTREQMQSFLNAKAKLVSRSTVDHLRFRLRSIFELAVSEGVVDRNAATTLYTPRHCQPGREKRVLTSEQFKEIMAALNLREQVILRLATIEAMRPGEVMAIKLGDIDLEANRLKVTRRVYRGNLDDPKTDRSVRELALSDGTAALIREYADLLANTSAEGWLFPGESGKKPIWKENTWRRHFLPKLLKLNLQWANFQVLRRTFASRAREAGVDAHTRSAQMGNTVDVNENEYAVSDFKSRLAAVRLFDAPFGK